MMGKDYFLMWKNRPLRLHTKTTLLASAITLAMLLAVLHRFARRCTPDLAHVLADAAVVLPMALILVAR